MYIRTYKPYIRTNVATAIAVVVGVSHLSGGRRSLRKQHKLAKRVCDCTRVCVWRAVHVWWH